MRCAHTLVATLLLASAAAALPERPNVVIFLADDLGWNDVSYHGGEIQTPAIDRLAAEGVRLERFYTAPICSPTRAALLTGRDPMRLGIAYDQIHPWYNAGLPPGAPTLATVFREAGYRTGIVGKWHLGHTQARQLPTAHGFDHFHGHLHTNTDYFEHRREGAHDLQENGKSVHEPGVYHQAARDPEATASGSEPAGPEYGQRDPAKSNGDPGAIRTRDPQLRRLARGVPSCPVLREFKHLPSSIGSSGCVLA